MKLSVIISFVIALAVPLAAGFAGSLVTMPSIPGWYATLQKPWFSPPAALFGPVWTTLYVLMGISLFIVWRKRFTRGLILFAMQLVLNFLWTVIFFGAHSITGAFAEIIVLFIIIVVYSISVWKVSRAASVLFLPYIAWVAFASVLPGAYMYLN